MAFAFIGLGTNQGNRLENLNKALVRINESPGMKVLRIASVYESAPIGYLEQDCFYNTVAELATSLSPQTLLRQLLEIEAELGRVRTIRWGPRTLDLDLLLYGGQTIREPNLEVPHPRMLERAFVMGPLAELEPAMEFGKTTTKEFFENLKNIQQISCIPMKVW